MRHHVDPWRPTGRVSPTCEHRDTVAGSVCGAPSVMAYPAMGGGYCALCRDHGRKHADICVTYEQALRGETPDFMTNPIPGAREVGPRLRARRQRMRITIASVAHECGLSENTVKTYESGYGTLTGLRKIEAALDRLKRSAAPSPIAQTEPTNG